MAENLLIRMLNLSTTNVLSSKQIHMIIQKWCKPKENFILRYQYMYLVLAADISTLADFADKARGRAGDTCGNVRGFDQSFATAVRGKYLGFALYRQKGL